MCSRTPYLKSHLYYNIYFQELPDSTTYYPVQGFPDEGQELPDIVAETDAEIEKDAHKINWLPVWEEHEQLRFARQVTEQPVGTTATPEQSTPKDILLPKENQECPTSAKRGLTNLVRVARPLLPASQLKNILANAVEDPQVRELIKLLRSDGFKTQVQLLKASKQHQLLHDYVCRRLKLDPTYYAEFVRVFLDLHISDPPTSKLPNRRPGVRGLLQDLRDALPRSELRDMYLRLYSSDSDLSTAIRLIRGSEFRRLLRDLRQLKEYRSLAADLEKSGVPLRQLQQLVASALGWSTMDMGGETVIWNV
ncbi:uncharacterized protein LOC122625970 isoform X1 [Drosophila teissieri]|uniref:uncharacterized protein LOC122625970 isoform X1 n=1 Tax=Drosophila teissieri TaxID=7243 RepID=UPI001CBA1870|nr:uncharacterized protein LOC122625970 isoform X1 [Drosophila teissieri]XP_043661982.1 uncharacterized protein LOC122625970 isoform X1 [Drosophila teissieri]